MERVPRGEAQVMGDDRKGWEILVTEIRTHPGDLPFDGDTVYVVPESLYMEMRAVWEADGG